MRLRILSVLIFIQGLASAQKIEPVVNKPPMGWNSYNCFGGNVTEQEVKANVDYMEKNLKQLGWEYIVVDFLWFCDDQNSSEKMANRRPHQYIDEYGRLIPSVKLHPSSVEGKGFKPLADYIHAKGLKFGIHIMRGIPRQAIENNTPIKNANSSALEVANLPDTCLWYGGLVGVNMTKQGAQEYYNSLFELYASWGVDFIKVDDISFPYHADEIEAVNKAILHSGRPMVLSLSPGPALIGNPQHLRENANMWRISKDFWDDWGQLKEQFNYARSWAGAATVGHYPDFDMLSLGKLAKRSELKNNKERYSKFTKDEQYTHMTLWSIFGSPLIFGGHLPENDPFTLSLITNEHVLKVNQFGKHCREIRNDEMISIWISEFQDSKELNVAVFNLDDNNKKSVTISLDDLKLEGKYSIRDLWEKKDVRMVGNEFAIEVNSHGAKIFTLTPRFH